MNLLSSASIFSFFTIISRILGYLRDILIAIFLGASIFADAFFVAFRLPNTFRRLFAEGTFNAAFIPSYTAAKLKNKKNGNILNVTVDFIAEVITCIRDKDKKIVSGNPEKIKKIYDTWIFSRDTTSTNPNWQLVNILT